MVNHQRVSIGSIALLVGSYIIATVDIRDISSKARKEIGLTNPLLIGKSRKIRIGENIEKHTHWGECVKMTGFVVWKDGKPIASDPNEAKRLDKRMQVIDKVLKEMGYPEGVNH